MLKLSEGQCGLCAHFGEGTGDQKVVQIRIRGEAPPELIEPCGLPANASKDLKVTPFASCTGYTPALSA
jgi:hypothetical protein